MGRDLPQRINDRGGGGSAGTPLPHRGDQGRELPAKTSRSEGFQRSERPAYVIDAGAMAVTIKGPNAAAQKNQGGDTKTGPPALRLTPEPQLG